MTFEINLRERGPPEVVPAAIWQDRELENPMRKLASLGVIKLSRTAVGAMLTPAHFVGDLRLPGATLTIHPKSPELLAAMERLALIARSRKAQHIEPRLGLDVGKGEDPAGNFVRALFDAVREGLPWNYGAETLTTSFPHGRLEFGPTISRLISRGITHRVVVTSPKHLQNPRLIRLVRAAYGCLSTAPGVAQKVLADAQAIMPALDQAKPFESLEEALAEARALMASTREGFSSIAMRLLVRSYEILAREYDSGRVLLQIPGGIARFQDLEELWERCVQLFVDSCPFMWVPDTVTRLHGLRGCGMMLLPDGGPELDPDIVAFRADRVLAVFDAKYKALESHASADSGDLYQLCAYVRSTSARLGMLVHFSDDAAGITRVGTTPEGAPIIAVSISSTMVRLKGESALAGMLAHAPSILKSCIEHFSDGLGHQGGDGVPNLTSNVLLGA